VTEFDALAESYDKTRGGESRGAEYAADIDRLLPPGDGPILEIGVGTGVVALGLRQLGRRMVGIDLSRPMIARAHQRLGSVVARSDAMRMSIGTGSVDHAISVWVVHSVADPLVHFVEAARVVRPGGRYLVCLAQRASPDDEVGNLIAAMSRRVDEKRGAIRPRGVTIEQVTGWAETAGWMGTIQKFDRSWLSTPAEELEAIALRQWPALRELDETSIEEVTRPVIDALQAMPQEVGVRRGTVDVIVFRRDGARR
jgi:ubiquinone/menaquinone biosynthesis C-methylase UbiE